MGRGTGNALIERALDADGERGFGGGKSLRVGDGVDSWCMRRRLFIMRTKVLQEEGEKTGEGLIYAGEDDGMS